MMWQYYGGTGWWLVMGAANLLFWIAIIGLAVWAIRALAGPSRRGDDALETLRRRLASGEITPEQYEQTRRLLQG